MINDVKIEMIDEGPTDPMGNAFVTLVMHRSSHKFDDAIDREDVKLVFLRSLELRPGGGFSARFNAYDAGGYCITSKVCEAVAQ